MAGLGWLRGDITFPITIRNSSPNAFQIISPDGEEIMCVWIL